MDGLKAILAREGADLVGFADLRGIDGAPLPYGVSVAVRLPAALVASLYDGPTLAYHDAYNDINSRLEAIADSGSSYLNRLGYAARPLALATVADSLINGQIYRSSLPHKTVATRAGLGWIGKCALLVTREYGSAVRLTSIITDAPLECAQPVTASECGDCRECVTHCPGGAVKGASWSPSADRASYYDAAACRDTARGLSRRLLGLDKSLCGRCFVVCPHTKRYLKREGALPR